MLPDEQYDKREARRKSKMATSRLEHAILQTIINHTAEEHIPRSHVIMALINVTSWWQKRAVLDSLEVKNDGQ